jgi:hypothetical protein
MIAGAWRLVLDLTFETLHIFLNLQYSVPLRIASIDYLGIYILRQQIARGLWSISKIIFPFRSRAYKAHAWNALPLHASPVLCTQHGIQKAQ